MRTDAKIGFAIGAVLLAVLTVYAIVVPKHSKKTAGTVALVPAPVQPTGADTPAPSSMSAASSDNNLATQPPAVNPAGPQVDPLKGTPGVATGHIDTPPTPPAGPSIAGNEIPNGGGINLTRPEELKPEPLHPAMPHEKKVKPAPFEVPETASATDRFYTIQSGQTLSKIAYEVYGNARFYVAIQRENRGLDANHLKVGSKIKLPDIAPPQIEAVGAADDMVMKLDAINFPNTRGSRAQTASHTVAANDARSYEVKPGDTLYSIARKVLGSGRKADLIYALNQVVIGPNKARLKLGMLLKLPESSRTVSIAQ